MNVSVGNLIEVKLPEGYAYGVILAVPAAYPPAIGFLPKIYKQPLADVSPDLWDTGYKVYLSPLNRAEENGNLQILTSSASPNRFPAPKFRVPILDRKSRVLYEWHWQSGRIELPGPDAADDLPVREIIALEHLGEHLETA